MGPRAATPRSSINCMTPGRHEAAWDAGSEILRLIHRKDKRTMAAPRLKEKYKTEIVPKLDTGARALGNVNQVPRLEKIVVNMGVGAAAPTPSCSTPPWPTCASSRPAALRHARQEVHRRLPSARRPGHRLQGHPARRPHVGVPRPPAGHRASSRVRDFRGLSPKSFDGRGNLHHGPHRAADLPGDRLRQDRPHARYGHHVRHDADNNEDAFALLDALGFPFKDKNAHDGTSPAHKRW